MARESQAPRVTEIQVRVDCNGCVQKIKKALNGIPGIRDLRVDMHQQKLTIIGWADPEQVVKAIKKTKKNATICSSVELPSPAAKPTEPEPKQNAPTLNAATQTPPAQPPPPQARPRSEPPPQHPPIRATQSHIHAQHNTTRQWQNNTRTEELEQVHVTHRHVPNYVNRFSSGYNQVEPWQRYHNGREFLQEPSQSMCVTEHEPNYVNRFSSGHNHVEQWERNHNGSVFQQEPSQSMYVTHSYNTHMPSSYVTEYEYVRSPSRYTHYNCIEHYSRDYQNGNVDVASMFSDDNPNACCIV